MARLALVLVSLSACIRVESSDVRTAGVGANIEVETTGDNHAEVTVYLHQGDVDAIPALFLDLTGNDRLYAAALGSDKALDRFAILGLTGYRTTFQNLGVPGTEFVVRFERAIDRGAPRSTCTMPNGFEVTSPPERTDLSRATADLDVIYSGSGSSDPMRYTLRGSCIAPVDGSVSGDLGTFKIKRADMISSDDDDKTATCDITLEMTRTRKGALDSNFGAGGRIGCKQTRTRVFRSSP